MNSSLNHEETLHEPVKKTENPYSEPPGDATIAILQSIDEHLEEMTKLLQETKQRSRPHRVFWRNFGIGIARGLGMTVGLTLVATLLVFILKPIISLPVIGDFIAEIVKMVQDELITLP